MHKDEDRERLQTSLRSLSVELSSAFPTIMALTGLARLFVVLRFLLDIAPSANL